MKIFGIRCTNNGKESRSCYVSYGPCETIAQKYPLKIFWVQKLKEKLVWCEGRGWGRLYLMSKQTNTRVFSHAGRAQRWVKWLPKYLRGMGRVLVVWEVREGGGVGIIEVRGKGNGVNFWRGKDLMKEISCSLSVLRG